MPEMEFIQHPEDFTNATQESLNAIDLSKEAYNIPVIYKDGVLIEKRAERVFNGYYNKYGRLLKMEQRLPLDEKNSCKHHDWDKRDYRYTLDKMQKTIACDIFRSSTNELLRNEIIYLNEDWKEFKYEQYTGNDHQLRKTYTCLYDDAGNCIQEKWCDNKGRISLVTYSYSSENILLSSTYTYNFQKENHVTVKYFSFCGDVIHCSKEYYYSNDTDYFNMNYKKFDVVFYPNIRSRAFPKNGYIINKTHYSVEGDTEIARVITKIKIKKYLSELYT